MNKYHFLEAIGAADEKFLEEALSDTELERRTTPMSKKKLVTIIIAAALVLSLGLTAVAAGLSRLSQLSDYFNSQKNTFHIPDEVPVIEDPDIYGNEVYANVTTAQSDDTNAVTDNSTADVSSYTPPAPGTAKITSVSSAGHSLFMTIEFNAEGLEIPNELPENAIKDMGYCFEWADTNFIWSGGTGEFISRNKDIFTYVFSRNNIHELPEDEIVIKLQRFGYFGYFGNDKDFVTLKDIEVEVKLPVSEINVMKPIKSNTVDIMNVEYWAELSAYDLSICADIDSLYAAGLIDSNGYATDKNQFDISLGDIFEVHMLDGTVFSEHLFTNQYETSHLIVSKSGAKNTEERKCSLVLSFNVPLDIEQIDYVVVKDYRFNFTSKE